MPYENAAISIINAETANVLGFLLVMFAILFLMQLRVIWRFLSIIQKQTDNHARQISIMHTQDKLIGELEHSVEKLTALHISHDAGAIARQNSIMQRLEVAITMLEEIKISLDLSKKEEEK